MTSQHTTIDMDKTLIHLNPESEDDIWTIDDAVKGISIMGGTGSGKTTASGRKIAMSFLKDGWGGIVLCAKNEEVELWKNYCADPEVNRSEDLIIFEKGAKLPNGEDVVFNPIDYEMKREGEGAGETQNLTNIFMNIYKMSNRISGEADQKGDDRFWDSALKRILNRTIELIKLAEEDLTYSNMVNLISSSDNVDALYFMDYINRLTDIYISDDERTRLAAEINKELSAPDQYCMKCLLDAYYNVEMSDLPKTDERTQAFNMVYDYFTVALSKIDPRTKATIIESFMGIAEPFLSGLLFRHFSGKTNIFPECTYNEERKKIIVLNFPIKEFLDAGIIGQSVFKLLFQQAIERRNTTIHPSPVFLWCDEAQYFINPYDQLFLTTARSSRTATVFLSQNISNYFAIMGHNSKAQVDSLMGNLCTKIFHANSDAETNEYASRLVGSVLTVRQNQSEQFSLNSLFSTSSIGTSSDYMVQIQPKDFTVLATGGERHGNKVEGIVVVSGRQWASGNNFLPVTWGQKFYKKLKPTT
jgi:hypothetical protein